MNAVIAVVAQGLMLLCEALSTIILFNSLLSMLSPGSRLHDMTSTFCEPFLQPFRNLLAKFSKSYMPFDFSPVFAMVALYMLSALFSVCIARIG